MNSNWKNRILNHEETVPDAAWMNIAQALDDETVKNKLLLSEQTPPADLWKNISLQLDDATKVVSINSDVQKKVKSVGYWRMAAAASAAIIIMAAAFWLFSNRDIKSQQTAVIKKQEKQEPIKQEPILVKDSLVIDRQSAGLALKSRSVPKRKSSLPAIDTTVDLNFVAEIKVEPLAKDPMQEYNIKLTGINGAIVNDITLTGTPNNYLTITGPNGESIKVSPKFTNLINYLKERDTSKEEYIDKVIKEGAYWKGKFKIWRDKMYNINLAPNPVNFFDFIELSNTIKEN